MSRSLDVAVKTTILSLVRQGWSYRRIHRELGCDREAISRLVRESGSKPANVPTGSGDEQAITVQTRPPGPGSQVEPYRAIVESKVKQGLDALRIYRDLSQEHGYGGGYDSVKRFVRKIRAGHPQVFARMEVDPGQEAQVDFGQAAPTMDVRSGRYRHPYLFKMTLSYSRHSYEEVVWRQTTESFIRCHENAFRFFGGVPRIIRLDNLKAGVNRACLYDPEMNKLYAAFAAHAGFVALPIRPGTPRHDGKVERGIGYTKNALKGRTFESLEAQNEFLRNWNRTVAALRIHGTTKQQVLARFLEAEKPALQEVREPFPVFRLVNRKVHPDGHVEIDKAYYSVPHHLVGREVEIRIDERLVRIYADRQMVAVHRLTQPGVFRTNQEHLPAHKTRRQEGYQTHLLAQAERLGPGALGFVKRVLEERGVLGFRSVQGVITLCRQYPRELVDWACAKALGHGSLRYQTVRELVKRQGSPDQPDLIQDHDIIRPLNEYAELIKNHGGRHEHPA